jgi:hypothetical protein
MENKKTKTFISLPIKENIINIPILEKIGFEKIPSDDGFVMYELTPSKLKQPKEKEHEPFLWNNIRVSARKNAPTARGHHGLTVEAQSWEGKIVAKLTREKDGDYFEVWRKPHHSSGGANVLISKGRLKSFSSC